MGLIEPVTVPAPDSLGPVHFIAIGGSGMNGIASVFTELGVEVSGSDRQDSPYLRALEARGARVHVGHAAEQLGRARTVVASSAIREDNPELAEARRRGLTILHRSAALASLMTGHRGISVAGTHGKTTTTAMISEVLTACGLDPSFVIGGARTGSKTGGHLGGGDVFVVEADESDGSFLQYPTEVAVVTNVDPDHLVNWGTPENYAAGFLRFATGKQVRLLVVSSDDPGAIALTEKVREHQRAEGSQTEGGRIEIITYGESPDADLRISDVGFAGVGSSFTLDGLGSGGPVELAVPGRYNVHNAAAAYAVARWLGAEDPPARAALAAFGGTYRRFQLVGRAGDIRVYDDYAHHPTEVAATLRAAQVGLDGGRLVACFQPHLYTRTRDFWAELAQALELADEAVVMDVCGDREDPIEGITGRMVSDAITPGTAHVTYEPDWDAAPAAVADVARPGDLVITIGCGDVTKIAPLIVAEIERRQHAPHGHNGHGHNGHGHNGHGHNGHGHNGHGDTVAKDAG
ncbi:UDP-N-acetylmuramate--L-alanine ligase [Microlunatus panaciterrae]|uniref:UDP-N-acetylmuramate--L-alanine ligase n=1 Tax=Microlunatus panaciterrae TaxID=400768 RepID=A0ABS2RMK8_9ACTN|nr:UDP-N-acetylmuramate--L-alanine ligase [Microlunatus panaciterrae]MBM7800207.1 UDP-N-acetylmuramate--alanine ligase [Microlunatus panaciterrae]